MNGLPVHRAGEAVHLALPRPSIWPLLLSAALCALMVGLLLIDQAPWLVLLAALFVFAGILGWALEDHEPEPVDQHETLILPRVVEQASAPAGAHLWSRYPSDILPSVDQRETLILPRVVEQVAAHGGAHLQSGYFSDTGPTAPLKVERAGDGPVPLRQSKGKSQFKRINDLFHEE
jgi:hypothetical protein